MDLIQVSQEIIKLQQTLKKMGRHIKDRIVKRAKLESEYDKALAVTIIELKSGVTKELGGKSITSPPVTLIPKISVGLCWQEKLNTDTAEAEYKSLMANIDNVKTQITALQSILKHIESI